MLEIYGIKTIPIIHSFTRRNFILFTYEKVVIKYVWLPSIWCLKSTVWKFIPSSSTIYSAIYIRYFLFSDLNSWNPYPTSLTVLCKLSAQIKTSSGQQWAAYLRHVIGYAKGCSKYTATIYLYSYLPNLGTAPATARFSMALITWEWEWVQWWRNYGLGRWSFA
jgi:hypothetical protein